MILLSTVPCRCRCRPTYLAVTNCLLPASAVAFHDCSASRPLEAFDIGAAPHRKFIHQPTFTLSQFGDNHQSGVYRKITGSPAYYAGHDYIMFTSCRNYYGNTFNDGGNKSASGALANCRIITQTHFPPMCFFCYQPAAD